jgi:hypothetical protein
MPVRHSKRPTLAPAFDIATFARESDGALRAARSVSDDDDAPDSSVKTSEVRLATRPGLGVFGANSTNEAWARTMAGTPRLKVTDAALKRLPLDHRAGFLLSLMDGSLDLETIIEISSMDPDDALALVRDLFESEIIEF